VLKSNWAGAKIKKDKRRKEGKKVKKCADHESLLLLDQITHF